MGNGFTTWFSRSYKGIIIGLATFGVAMLVVIAMQHVAASAPAADSQAGPIPTYSSASSTVRVSILSDSHAYNANSWWRQTVAAGTVDGISMGKFDSTPGVDTEHLKAQAADSASEGGWVIVQAGTNDLLSGRTPQQALDGLTTLWDDVDKANAKPIAALVPPSDERPADVVKLNELIQQEATARGIPLLDVYSVVAADDGSWAGGHSTDGRHADPEASDKMADAAQTQLPTLVAA